MSKNRSSFSGSNQAAVLFARGLVAGCAIPLLGCGSAATTDQPDGGAGHTMADGGAERSAPVCKTVAPPAHASLPHVSASGAKAAAVHAAIGELLAAQSPPLAGGAKDYAFSSLGCEDLWVQGPGVTDGYSCSFTLSDGGKKIEGSLAAPSALAQKVFDALTAAGGDACNDEAHGNFVRTQSLESNATQVSFDDASNEALTPAPNVTVKGAAAEAVVNALADAKVDDCAPQRKIFLLCNTFDAKGGAPSCAYQWDNLWKVGTSELVYTCRPVLPNGGDTGATGGTFDAVDSKAIWEAIVGAAQTAGYKPESGTIAEATLINASYLSYDGDTLGMTLVLSNATPPPPPPPHP